MPRTELVATKASNLTSEIWNWYRFEKSDEQVYVKYNAALHPKRRWNDVIFELATFDRRSGDNDATRSSFVSNKLTWKSDVEKNFS